MTNKNSNITFRYVLAITSMAFGCMLVSSRNEQSFAQETTNTKTVVSYPLKTDPRCRKGKAKLYDECSNQLVLFEQALEKANLDGKVLLVSYGAEWCIWCHVLDAHLFGGKGRFHYVYGSPDDPDARSDGTMFERDADDEKLAEQLRELVATSFILVHVDSQFAPNSDDVLDRTGAGEHLKDSIPFVFSVDKQGKYVAELNHNIVEKRRDTADWYRGYNRSKLIQQLMMLRDAASQKQR